jgi:type I restriction enzyme M protein
MYLHGDGGSRIYAADGLDKVIDSSLEADPETIHDLQELRSRLNAPMLFDVVLTNPPFAMTRESKNETDHKILLQYMLARKSPGSAALRTSLRSSVMYLERYHDLLHPGKMLITVIDDALLASQNFAEVRDFIRSKFLIRAIISLPGDTFRRSGSRVKTSVLALEKKQNLHDTQPSCFAFFSEQLGIDDLTPRASPSDIQEARDRAAEETEQILAGYTAYLQGKPRGLILPPERIGDRLDLKFCVPYFGRLVERWRQSQVPVKKLSECIRLIEDKVIPSEHPDELFKLVGNHTIYDG